MWMHSKNRWQWTVFVRVLCRRSHSSGVWTLQASGSRVFSSGADCCIKAWDLNDLIHGCKTSIVAHSQRVSQHCCLSVWLLCVLSWFYVLFYSLSSEEATCLLVAAYHIEQAVTCLLGALGVVKCQTCAHEVAGSNLTRGCCVPIPTQCATLQDQLVAYLVKA